jgi:hypothetical protein
MGLNAVAARFRMAEGTRSGLSCSKRHQPSAFSAAGVRRAAMAKGQVRSNKEVRKPKAEKAKPPVTVGSSPFTQPPGKK